MKKLMFLFLVAVFLTNCQQPKKDEPTAATNCLISRIDYEDGTYEKYVFDEKGLLKSTTINYLDENNKLIELPPFTYEYTAAGLLKTTFSDGGYTDNYIYDAAGKLTSIEFKDGNKELYEKITVTLDDKGRLKTVQYSSSNLKGQYEYNGPNGVLSKVEVFLEGEMLDKYEVTSFDTNSDSKGYDAVIKGHFFDPTLFTDALLYAPMNPAGNSWGLPTTGKISTTYDENWENITKNLRVYSDYTSTYESNSNKFLKKRITKDKVDNSTFTKSYQYSNCQ